LIGGTRTWLLIVAAWTVLGLLEAAKGYVVAGQQYVWWWSLVANMPWWYGWAFLSPVAFWIAARWPITAQRWAYSGAIHVVAAFALSTVHLVGTAYITHWLTRGHAVATLGRQISVFVMNFFVVDLVVYAAIIGAYFALDYGRRWRESTLASARLESHASRLELGLVEARLQALRMELNPHFLFNTLNAIAGLVRKHENDAAVGMLARLGDLLRVTLDRDLPQRIAIEDELTLLQQYLDIERARFGARLNVAVELDASAKNALVPTLVCQPFAENAVRHGVSRQSGAVEVAIRAVRNDTMLTLEISDTGRGLGFAPLHEGIGLSNTRARLFELYGDRATLELRNAAGGGTVATVRLPFQPATAQDYVHVST
jgi:anti-sigma regulatory factor (Ser/Thr protein kinase)